MTDRIAGVTIDPSAAPDRNPAHLVDLLIAVEDGATLELQGPRPDANVPVRGCLESSDGQRSVRAGGRSAIAILVELGHQWRQRWPRVGVPRSFIMARTGARLTLAEPFVPALKPQALRIWRSTFQQLHALPSVASAGLLLIQELERAYAALDDQQ